MTLKKKIALLLLLPLVGALAGLGFFFSYLNEMGTEAHFIDVAGRQRMLSVELLSWARMVAAGQEEDRDGLRDRVGQFDRALTSLLYGGDILEGSLDPAPPEVRPALEQVLALWQGLEPDLDTITALSRAAPQFEPAYQRIETGVPALLDASRRVVSTHAARAMSLRRQMMAILAAIAAGTLVIFIAGIVLAHRFIARPILRLDAMARRISAGDFSQRLEVTTRDELATLARGFNDMAGQIELLFAALDHRRKHAEKLVACLPVGLLVTDSELRVVSVNRFFLERCRCELAALVGRPVVDVLALSELEPHLRDVLATDEARTGLFLTVHCPDTGEALPTKIAVTKAELPEDGAPALLLLVEDLSEQERRAALARAAMARFQQAVETARDGIILMGPEGNIIFFNRSAEELFGWRHEEVLGKLVTVLMPEKYRAALEHGLARYIATQESTVLGKLQRLEGLRKDGSAFPIEANFSANLLDDGFVFAGFLRDVTDRQQAEAALHRSEARFRGLIESLPDGIAVHRQGRFVYVNSALLKTLGYERAEELLGRSVLDIMAPDERLAVATRVQTVVDTGMPVPMREERLLRRDGSIVIAEITALPLVFDGEPVVLAIGRDITERKRTAERMMMMDRMATVGTLAAGIAHEINTPIQFVSDSVCFLREAVHDFLRFTETLQAVIARIGTADEAPGKLQEALASVAEAEEAADLAYLQENVPAAFERCVQGLERIATIVRAMKDFAHPDQSEMAPADLNRAIESTLVLARSEYKDVAQIETHLGEIPLVTCYLSAINQVLLNLIVNAAHAIGDVVKGSGKQGTITVSSRQDGGHVVIAIADTGAGIPVAIASRIFEPFFTTKEVGKGTGQGLTLAWQTVTVTHQGELTFESQPGPGTTFFIRLPIAGKPRAAA